MYYMVKNIEFWSIEKSPGEIMVFSDKKANMYEMSKEEYAKLINHIITKTYQKTTRSTKTKINKEINFAKKIIKLENKMEQYAHQSTYVTLKDHKQNFKNKLLWWLIKPAKNEIGIVSKEELGKINRVITNQVKGNQRCKTQAVIDWFKSTTNKTKPQFINDIVEFYPYITQNLLNNAVSNEQTLKAFPNYIIQLVKQVRKSLVFNQGNADEKRRKHFVWCHRGIEGCYLWAC